jgi:hypothetical protein
MRHDQAAAAKSSQRCDDAHRATLLVAAELGAGLTGVSDVELRYVTEVILRDAGPGWEDSVAADIARLVGRMDRRAAFRRRLIAATSDIRGPEAAAARRVVELASAHTPQDVHGDELWRAAVTTLLRRRLNGT